MRGEPGGGDKIGRVRALWGRGDRLGALAAANKIQRLGEDGTTIRKGYSAMRNPDFYRQLGKNPEEMVRAALAAMVSRFAL